MLQGDHPGLEIEVHNALVSASCRVLSAVKNVLRPTPMPGRKHYLFSLRDIVKCFQVRVFTITYLCYIMIMAHEMTGLSKFGRQSSLTFICHKYYHKWLLKV